MRRLAVLLIGAVLLGSVPALAHEQWPAERRMSELIALNRQVRDLHALRHGTRLHKWGRKQVARMIECRCVSHAKPPPFCGRWAQAVGIGGSVLDIFLAFMQSPTHRAAILNPRMRRIGVGARRSGGLLYIAVELCG